MQTGLPLDDRLRYAADCPDECEDWKDHVDAINEAREKLIRLELLQVEVEKYVLLVGDKVDYWEDTFYPLVALKDALVSSKDVFPK